MLASIYLINVTYGDESPIFLGDAGVFSPRITQKMGYFIR
jgi:hypothetical protein